MCLKTTFGLETTRFDRLNLVLFYNVIGVFDYLDYDVIKCLSFN